MKNFEWGKFIPPALQEAMYEFELSYKDVDKMDYQQFKEFCGQLEIIPLKQLRSRTINPRFQIYIDNLLDNVERIKNKWV